MQGEFNAPTWYVILVQSDLIYTWVDQKVLKLLAYLFNYTTELYKTYTEY